MSRREVVFAMALLVAAATAPGVERTWVNTSEGAGGPWTDGSLWIPVGVPEFNDDLRITTPGNYSCFTDGSFEPRSLIAGGGAGLRELEVSAGTTLAPRQSAELNANVAVTVLGTLSGSGQVDVNAGAALLLQPGSTLGGTGPLFSHPGGGIIFDGARIETRGLMLAGSTDFNGVVTMSKGVTITNLGSAVMTGTLVRGDTSAMSFDNRGDLGVLDASAQVEVINSGTVNVQSGTFDVSGATYKQTSGSTIIAPGASLAGPVEIGGGTLAGSGTVSGNVSNAGTVALATPTTFAAFQINGNYTQAPAGKLEIKIGSRTQFDRLFVTGVANLAGQMSIRFVQGYVPALGTEFPILNFGSRSGDFSFYEGVDLGDIEMVPVFSPNGLSLVAQVKQPCTQGRLCLNEGRFEVSLTATDPRTGNVGPGVPVRQNDIFGYFSIPALTSDATNPEVFIKILDGRVVNGKFWVFYGTLTDFELTLTVVDTVTQQSRSYVRPGGQACGEYDTGAFKTADTFVIASAAALSTELSASRLGQWSTTDESAEPSPEVGCVTTETSLCLQKFRFAVTLSARDQRTGATATGLAIPRNDLFGYFTLPGLTGNAANVEVFVKVIDGRVVNGRFWVFFGGLTDLEYTLVVRDIQSLQQKVYTKEAESPCGRFDTGAF